MIQSRGGASFQQETIEGSGITGELRGKKFESDAAAKGEVLCLIHYPHPAAAQTAGDAVVRDGLTDHRLRNFILGWTVGTVKRLCPNNQAGRKNGALHLVRV